MDRLAAANETPKRHHALAVPFCGQGHLNPLMKFCKKLAKCGGFVVTFVDIDPVYTRIKQVLADDERQQQKTMKNVGLIAEQEEEEVDIRRVSMAVEGLDLKQDFRVSVASMINAYNECGPQMQRLAEQLDPPVTCIIADLVVALPANHVATSLKIPWIAFYPSSLACCLLGDYILSSTSKENGNTESDTSASIKPAPSLEAVLEILTGRTTQNTADVICEGLPGLPTITKRELINFKHVVNDNDFAWRHRMRALHLFKTRGDAFVVNSSSALEGLELQALSHRWGTQLPVHAVGPLMEPLKQKCSTSLWKEDEQCLEWLDRQRPGSVLYISFGSFTLLSVSQVDEFVAGLLSTGRPFLWSLRPDLVIGGCLPAHLDAQISEARAEGRAYVAHWVPQNRVLSHQSVGGFLTHCGWNSVLEAVYHGVPMLCWPYFTDQFLDAMYMADVWKIGLYFPSIRKGDTEAQRSEIEAMISLLMEGDDAERLRENAKRLQEKCRTELLPEGTSPQNIQQLIDSLQLGGSRKPI
ncbi:hypothetical protein KP509_04G110900 [Ceratopteris richardii]|uniref:Glycosyltransferase n=1 Tax=Ceratopteris richardii TaxID=49495 RepID=A0A8T2V081_CERRI|nr:hypothetical protein KP509_04G110900 [Ceratopteris richardii]